MKHCLSNAARFISILVMGMMVLFASDNTFAQSKKDKNVVITGTIRDAQTGEPVIGAAVYLKATQVGAVTDVDGSYLLAVPDAKDGILIASSLGYIDAEAPINGRSKIDFQLKTSLDAIDETVVVGYSTQKKISVTGALSTVEPSKLQKTVTPSLSNALGGIMPGVITRQSSGEPGYDQAAVYIRGVGTWGNAAPLVLVDGIERDLNIITPSDIESFTILKDASATAVYGMKGANGVILINTKKGVKGKPKVTFRTEFADLEGLRFADYINGYEFATLMNEATIQGGGTNLPWSDEQLQKFKSGSDPYLYPSVDWTDEVLKRHTWQSISNLSVSGGNDIVRYYVNAGFTTQSGLFKEDPQYEYRTNSLSNRYNFRSNLDISVTKNFSIELGLSEIVEERTYPGRSSGEIFTAIKKISPIQYPIQNPDGSYGGGVSYLVDNPWTMVTQSGYATQFRSTTQGTLGAKWDLSDLVTKGLSVQGRFSYDHYYFNEVFRRKNCELKDYLGKDPITGEDKYNLIREETAMGYSISQASNRAYYMEISAHYDRTFGKHNVNAMVLFNRRDYKDLTAGSSTANLPYRRQGIASRLTYNYDNRYLIEGNLGYNGSENFPKGQRYGLFPAFSLGWIMSNESWWNDSVVNHLKLRGSYGLVGNDQTSSGARFLYLSTVNKTANGYYFGQSQAFNNGMAELTIGAANLSWEVATKSDVGFDLELFNGLVNLQADAFFEVRDGILLQRAQIPDIMGTAWGNTPWANLGIVHNWGGDGQLEIRHTTPSGFYFSIRANATFARNKIIEDDSALPLYDYQATRGQSVGQPFGLIALGFFNSEEEILNSPTQTYQSVVHVGDVKYKDVNDDGVIDDYDRVPIGYTRTPELMFGFGGTFAYKGFDLTLNFTGATRTSTFLDTEGMWPFQLEYPNYNVLREYYDNRYIVGADNTNAKYPAVINGNSPNNYRTSTLFLRDASYIRLKNAEFGYNFTDKVTDKLGIEGLRLFVSGVNLLTFDYLKVIDPESNYGTGGYPTQRTLNIGLQINF